MAGYNPAVTTSSTQVFTGSDTAVSMITINNVGSNPVTIDTVTPVVAKAGIYLPPGSTHTIDLKTNNASIKKLYAIATGGSSELSIFTL